MLNDAFGTANMCEHKRQPSLTQWPRKGSAILFVKIGKECLCPKRTKTRH